MSRSSTVMFAVLLSAAATTTAWAASSKQFDLSCKGEQVKGTNQPATPWAEQFRFDLDAGKWCRGECKSTADIDSVTTEEILLSNSRATTGGPGEVQTRLSRADGKIEEFVMMGWSGGTANLASGECTRELFSGFPGSRF